MRNSAQCDFSTLLMAISCASLAFAARREQGLRWSHPKHLHGCGEPRVLLCVALRIYTRNENGVISTPSAFSPSNLLTSFRDYPIHLIPIIDSIHCPLTHTHVSPSGVPRQSGTAMLNTQCFGGRTGMGK